jgi:hypothetical protein
MSTRFYFPTADAAAVSPSFDSGWTYTAEAVRRAMTTTRPTAASGFGATIGPWSGTAGDKALDRQYVSGPLAAQRISGTVKAYFSAFQGDNADNVDQGILKIAVVSRDGATLRGTLLALGSHGPTTELIGGSLRNKAFADGDALDDLVIEEGDRLVVELGWSNSTAGTTPEATIFYGGTSGLSDAEESEAVFVARVGWLEFSDDLVFESDPRVTHWRDERKAIEADFEAGWDEYTPIQRENVVYTPTLTAPYVALSIRRADEAEQISLGSSPEHRYFGVVYVQCFSLGNRGPAVAEALADRACGIFMQSDGRRRQITSGSYGRITYGVPVISDTKMTGGYWAVTVAVPYHRDQTFSQ